MYISVNLHIHAFKYGFSTLFCLIPVLFQSYSSGIPEESCHSCGIPVEWQDSCRNRWGTVKYCPQREHPSRWFLDPTIQSSSKALALQGFVVSKEHHKQKQKKNEKSCVRKPNPEPVSFRGGENEFVEDDVVRRQRLQQIAGDYVTWLGLLQWMQPVVNALVW